jgi:hypothetical protein
VIFSDASGIGPAGAGDGVSRLLVSVLVDPGTPGDVARVVPPTERGWTPMGPSLDLPGGLRVAMVPTADHHAAAAWWGGLVDAASAVGAWHTIAARVGGWVPGSDR